MTAAAVTLVPIRVQGSERLVSRMEPWVKVATVRLWPQGVRAMV